MTRTTAVVVGRWLVPLSLLLAVGLFAASSHAVTYPDKPSRSAYFVDEAGIIDADDADAINEIASKLLSEERVPLFVVTIRSLADYGATKDGVDRYARKLFDNWGIGSKKRSYGMLLLISIGERKARIELGAHWDGRHDRQARTVMDDLIIPQFKRGDFSTGILDGVRGMDAMARDLALPKAATPWWFWPVVIVGLAVIIAVIVNLFRTGRSGWGWALIAMLGVMMFFAFRSAMSGSGGGFSGGFGGGGGASGSW